MRQSIGYSFKNKYGEGQRDDEDDSSEEEAPMGKVASRMSNKDRMSTRIKKLGTVETAFTIFKAFVGLGVLQLPA